MDSLLSKLVTAWEYKRVYSNNQMYENELNKLGNDGWELTGFSATGTYYYYVFKRRKFKENQD